jgi:hypothetical protein
MDFEVLATTRKEWTLHRFGHLIGAEVLTKSLGKIFKFPKLLFLEVFASPGRNLSPITCHQICNYQGTKDVTISRVDNADLTLSSATTFALFTCVNITVPAGVVSLRTYDSSITDSPLLKLTHLRISYDKNFKIDNLKDCANLESVRLKHCPQIQNIDSLQRFPHLSSLRLGKSTIIKGLEMLTQLTSLDINMDYVDMWQITRLTNLRSLVLRRWRGIYGFDWLHKLTRLDVLSLANPRDEFESTWAIFAKKCRFRLVIT